MTDRETTAPEQSNATVAQPPWQAAQAVPPPRAPQPPAQAPWLRTQQPPPPVHQPSTPPPHWAPQPTSDPQAAETLVQPAVPAAVQQPAPGQTAPWGPPGTPGGPFPPPAPGAHRRRGSGTLLWAALGALLAAAILVGVAFFGDDLWNGTEASGSDRPAPSAAQEEDPADTGTDTETLPDLPTLEPDPGAEPPVETDPGVVNGDLGLGVPMTSPACDGTWVVFLGAATDPAAYESDVQTLLDANPGAQYTLTQGSCSSMRQSLPDGTLIYTVWTGPYADQAQACAARAGYGDGAYVKRMDDSTPPEQLWEC